ncbi:Cytochrome P450 [Penicillium concentricum]|uniref:Cytochrome P450 monooxygenase poxM n=1 Tax=Penicillium concentricum TaxID=293559 RepID=A0A9W9RBC8_9EURO|nr:Cytochrome P450 [Penicillium concentricum]KAJ5356144.1 Cytochrome P450 [Penicillium concentricum]
MASNILAAKSPSVILPLAGFSGLTAQLLFYRHGEWDLTAPRLVVSYIFLFLGATLLERYQKDELPIGAPSHLAAKVVGCHILGIYASMLFYRAFLHRLSRFPGPFLARLSNFHVTFLSARKLQLYEETEKLHEQYGDYVRLGPTELSITDPRAVKAIYSSSAKVTKGPWYTVLEPRVSLQMVRNKQVHAQRRKAWDQGFSTRALRDYEPRVSYYTEQLIQVIEREVGNQINMAQWFNYYSFDVMGDLSFGKSFNMLIDGKDAYILKQLHGDLKMIGLFAHLTWLFPFFKKIPLINADYLKFWKWVDARVDERIQSNPDAPDVFSWILKAYEQGPKTNQDKIDLSGDAYLIIVAGSDTTAATLTNILFHLAMDRTLYKTLQKELDALPSLSYDNLRGVKLLDGVINETLRLHPPVPSGMQRTTPPEGITIGEKYIPGEVRVCIPLHTVFRDERIFARSLEFLPERWDTQPELVKDPAAFVPFSAGPYSCVGKQLGLMELRSVTAEILTRFDVSFAPDQTAAAFIDGKQDTFTLATAPLKVVFQKRDTKGF